jgi:tRNA(fMet)-specific endonuclease VapC
MVVMELWYGVALSQRWEESARSLRFFLSGPVDVVVFGQEDAELAGRLRAELDVSGTPIGPYDLLIGAQAHRMGATLVTANRSEFEGIVGLAIDDWTPP